MKKTLLSATFLTIVVMGINFVFKVNLSYKIEKDELGIFYTFMDLISIGIMVFSGFKDSLVVAFDKMDYEKVLFWYKRVFLVFAFLVLVVEIIYYQKLSFNYPIYFLFLLFIFNVYMIYLSYINASQKIYKIMLFENLVMALGLVGGYLFFSFFINGIYALLSAFLFSYLARIVFIKFFSPMKLIEKKAKFSEVKDFFKNSFLSSVMYFFSGFFINISGIIFLYFYNDKSILSEFQVVARSIFFSLVAVFVFPLNSYLFPHISEFIAKKEFFEIKRMEKKLIIYLILFFLVLLISTSFTKFLIGLVFPKEYINGAIMLNFLLPFLPFIAYTTFALNIIKAFNRFDLALIVRVLGSISFLVSFLVFYYLKITSFKTLIFSFDIAFFVMFLVSVYFRRRVLK